MMRLDHNRAKTQIALKTNHPVADIRRMTVWGNHSATQYPHIDYCMVGDKPATDLVTHDWTTNDFTPTVQRRGTAIIEARGASSAASAADAAISHMNNWVLGTEEGDWVSMAIPSSDGFYGIDPDLVFSYPVTCKNGTYEIVQDLELSEYSREKIKLSEQELLKEREIIKDLLHG